jgi:predicted phage tail protein
LSSPSAPPKGHQVVIAGAGSGKSGGGGGGLSEKKDTLRSTSYAQVLDLIGEGEIGGLVDGLRSIYLDDTPVENPDGSYNFNEVQYAHVVGTQDQPMIAGYDQVRNERPVGVEAKISSGPVVRTITNTEVTSISVTVDFPALTYLDNEGNLGGTTVEYAIDIQNNGGGWVEKINETIKGKSSSRYERQYRINLPAGGPWDVRLRRITADATTTATNNKTFFKSYTEIIDAKLRYPNSALVALKVEASQFTSIPKRGYDVKLLLIKFPTNATVRDDGSLEYSGIWDGTFQIGWCSDPAWCYYDALTNPRYGLGRFITDGITDKWYLYQISRYCAELVDDGRGGLEPRFSCNVYFQSRAQAYTVINNFTSIFRGMAYWAAGGITTTQDAPSDPVYLYTNSNVKDGRFTYVGSSAKARHTVALVTYNDPDDMYRQKVEYVENAAGIARYGVIETEVLAFGCSSRGQAHRMGRWILFTEYHETEVCHWTAGEEGQYARPGQVVMVADQSKAGKRMGGRVKSATTSAVVVDVMPTSPGPNAKLYCLSPDGSAMAAATISSISGTTVNLAAPLAAAPVPMSQWIISSDTLEPRTFRVLAVEPVAESDGVEEVSITALEHYPDKYAFIEEGIALQERHYSVLSPHPAPVASVTLTEALYFVGNDVRSKITANWPASQGATTYRVEWRQADGNFGQDVTGALDYDILNTAVQKYEVTVTPIGPFGTPSASSTAATINALGKTALPADVTGLVATIDPLIGVTLDWANNTDIDLDQYEVREGSDWATATLVRRAKASDLKIGTISGSSATYLVKAIDTSGNYSLNAASVTTNISLPGAPTVSVQVVDNNVLLKWTPVTSTLAIERYEIRRGATWAGGVVAGDATGSFTTLFETAAGAYTYWVAGVDIGGNYGTPASVAATVSAPPDYQLFLDFDSTFTGTKTNCMVSEGALYMALNLTETWTTHFTSRSWAGPSAQITAGFPNFAQPTETMASYEEVIDYGTTLPAAKVTLTGNSTIVYGAATLTPTISVSNTSSTGPWTDYAGQAQVYASAFRWIKVKYDLVSTGGDDLVRFDGINVTIDVKVKNDGGGGAAVSTDAGGTVVNFNVSFIDIASINVTAAGTVPRYAMYDFVDAPNPTSFKVLLFDTAGARVSGDFSWSAKGY